jgi:hypothetical protein
MAKSYPQRYLKKERESCVADQMSDEGRPSQNPPQRLANVFGPISATCFTTIIFKKPS